MLVAPGGLPRGAAVGVGVGGGGGGEGVIGAVEDGIGVVVVGVLLRLGGVGAAQEGGGGRAVAGVEGGESPESSQRLHLFCFCGLYKAGLLQEELHDYESELKKKKAGQTLREERREMKGCEICGLSS